MAGIHRRTERPVDLWRRSGAKFPGEKVVAVLMCGRGFLSAAKGDAKRDQGRMGIILKRLAFKPSSRGGNGCRSFATLGEDCGRLAMQFSTKLVVFPLPITQPRLELGNPDIQPGAEPTANHQ